MKLIKIDNVEYNVYDSKITRSFQVLDGENAGRLMNGKMERDIIGTYYNYTWELDADNEEVYDSLYEVLSAPVDSHIIEVPYGRNQRKVFEAYVTSGQDELYYSDGTNYHWTGLSIQFIAMEPNRVP